MASPDPIPPSVVRGLLQAELAAAAECVRDLHADGARTIAGVVEVEPAPGALARAVRALAGIPRTSGPLPAELSIECTPAGERWSRTIGAWQFRSLTTARRGELIERVGCFDVRFALSVQDRGIRYSQTGAALRLLGVRVPLPSFCAPRIEALERPDADGRSAFIAVTLSLPIVGRLVRYEGLVRRVPA